MATVDSLPQAVHPREFAEGRVDAHSTHQNADHSTVAGNLLLESIPSTKRQFLATFRKSRILRKMSQAT